MSQTSGATRRLWDTKAPPTSALRDYGLASQARETDGDGLRLVAYASESAPSLPIWRKDASLRAARLRLGKPSARETDGDPL